MSLLHVARHRPPPALVDTFLMARRHSVFPILNTAETGTWSWVGDAAKLFGGVYTNTSNASGNSFSLDNLNLFNAGLALNLLHTKASNGCTVSVYWGTKDEPTDLLGTFSTWAATTQKNVVEQIDLGTVPKGRETLHFVVSAAGAGGGHTMQIQQAEVVQLSGSNLGTSIDDLPWWVDVPPFAYDSTTGPGTLFQATGYSWGSLFRVSDSVDDNADYKAWLPQGTGQLRVIHGSGIAYGTATIDLNGSSVGTVDGYSVGTNTNVSTTLSGISVPSTGVHTIGLTVATKNESASNFAFYSHWLQFRKTAAHGAITPTGATYGRETMELWPWFADSGSDFNTFTIGATDLYYGYYYKAVTNDPPHSLRFANGVNPGNFDLELVGPGHTVYGIVHFSEDGGGDLDTVDLYRASLVRNQKNGLSGALTGGVIHLDTDTKNASSTDYYAPLSQIRLTRTGA